MKALSAAERSLAAVEASDRPEVWISRFESDEILSAARRIDEAARYIPLENLALSPQCGFASVAAGNLLSMDDQWRKLELVVETARKVWGSR